MARLRYNGLAATLGGAGLTATDTAITFSSPLTHSGGVSVPTLSGSDYLPMTITTSSGAVSEIVYLTAYASGGTAGTITRAQEGTTATTHAAGDGVMNSPTVLDIAGQAVGCRLYTTASQSFTGGWATVTFDTESFDSDGFHSTSTNPSRITIPAGLGGKYLVAGTISYAQNSTGSRHVSVYSNGTTRLVPNAVAALASFRTRVATLGVLSLAAGDYIELQGYQDSGGALQVGDTTTNGAVGETWVAVTYLGA